MEHYLCYHNLAACWQMFNNYLWKMYVCVCMCDKRCEEHFSQIIIKYILFIMVDCIELIESHGMPHRFGPHSCICSQPRVSINEWVEPSWILVTTFAFVNEYCRSETLKTYVGSSFDHLWHVTLLNQMCFQILEE